MADTIAARVAGRKHICDESMELAEAILSRVSWRAKFRHAYAAPRNLNAIYAEAGIDVAANIPDFRTFGALWSYVENNSPLLAKRRLSWEEMYLELLKLKKIREDVRAMVRPRSKRMQMSRAQ